MATNVDSELIQLFAKLRKHSYTLSLAESCTGGLLSSWVTRFSGVSDFFLGSVTSYSNQVKRDLLLVSELVLKEKGAVSQEVALAMAFGAQKQLKSHCSIALTGIAGPTGGSGEKPVGTVWISAVGPDFEVTRQYHFLGEREDVQKQAALAGVRQLFESLQK